MNRVWRKGPEVNQMSVAQGSRSESDERGTQCKIPEMNQMHVTHRNETVECGTRHKVPEVNQTFAALSTMSLQQAPTHGSRNKSDVCSTQHNVPSACSLQ